MLKNVILENFRNHEKYDLNLKKTTILVGPNGVGKSNILEAISVLSSCRSFREEDKRNLVSNGKDFGRVKGDELEVFIQKNPSLLLKAKDKGVFKKRSLFIGLLKSVVFSPETMMLATGTPRVRRRFLDMMISQRDQQYLGALIAYEKIRAQRNSLLQRIKERQADEGELSFWDEGLILEGNVVIQKRQEAIDYLNEHISLIYQNISGKKEDVLSIAYQKNEDFESTVKNNHQKEIWQGCTLFGPHRDDISITLNGLYVANFASRGEIRSAVLAIKIGELEFLTTDQQNLPILLLDDVYSEFDEERREHLNAIVENYQSVITTTDTSHLSGQLLNNAAIIEMRKNGKN